MTENKKVPKKYDTASATGQCCLDPMGRTEIKIKPPADVPLLAAAGDHRSEEIFHSLEQTQFDMVCTWLMPTYSQRTAEYKWPVLLLSPHQNASPVSPEHIFLCFLNLWDSKDRAQALV